MQLKHLIFITLIGLYSESLFSQDSFENLSTENLNFEYSPQKITAGSKGFRAENFAMGIKGGVNFSLIIPVSGNSIFSGSGGDYSKQYSPFYQNVGFQMGFVIRYSISQAIKINLQPSLNDYSFKYSNEYGWQGTTNLSYLVEHHQNMRFFEIIIC